MPTSTRTHEYPMEFKTQAVLDPEGSTFLILTMHLAGRIASGLGSLQLAITNGKSRRVVADELGVGMSTLCKWVKQRHHTPDAAQTISPVTGLTILQALEHEVRRLKRENEILRQEREILIAATRLFAKENQ